MEESFEIDGKYYLEEVAISETSSRGTLSPLPLIVSIKDTPGDGDLGHVQKLADEKIADERARAEKAKDLELVDLGPQPEMIDDFIRNYFANMGLTKTLAQFQAEWFELEQKGEITALNKGKVNTIYLENQELNQELNRARHENRQKTHKLDEMRDAFVRLRKERDYHKMHHGRLEQEKTGLLNKLKWTKNHYSSYPPALNEMKSKYESAMKEKMLITLERDRVVSILAAMPPLGEDTTAHVVTPTQHQADQATRPKSTANRSESHSATDQQQQLEITPTPSSGTNAPAPRVKVDTPFPNDMRVNPKLDVAKKSNLVNRLSTIKVTNTHEVHEMPVSWVDFHPEKHLICTASDDRTWQVINVTDGESQMTGSGHSDWLSCARFSPNGALVATSSGDRSVRIWDLNDEACVVEFDDHTQATWSVAWHTCGQFVASCSMDGTSKIWDLGSERCRNTLRGHHHSVMSVQFVYGSSTILTSSSDNTLKLWDARTGLCHHTFQSHQHSVNSAALSAAADMIASVDVSGVVNLWDVRNGQVQNSISLDCRGDCVTFDPSGEVIGVAVENGAIELIDVATMRRTQLIQHASSVNCIQFDQTGDMIASCSSDGTVKIWS